jgi:hypothetical protein
MIRFLSILLILLCLNVGNQAIASCSSWDDPGCNGSGNRGDQVDFSVSGTFFDPVLNFTYNYENSINLLVWTCHELCPTSFQLHWWGECQTQYDFNGNSQRVCARLIQAAQQVWICAFYDPVDNPSDPTNPGLDTNPAMSPFHGQVTTPCYLSGTMSGFVDSSGSIYSHQNDCGGCPSLDNCTGLYRTGNIDGQLSLSAGKYTSGPAANSPIQTCSGVFGNACGDPSSLTSQDSITNFLSYMQPYGQVLSTTQASNFLSTFKNLGSSLASPSIPLNAKLPAGPGSNYDMQMNPMVCALVPTAPAPPPFCSPMPISKPPAQIIPICSTTDTLGYSTLTNTDSSISWPNPIGSLCPSQPAGQALMPYYNLATNSTLLSPCEIGQSNGNILTNSYTTPAARVTFSQPFAANNCTLDNTVLNGAKMISKTAAQSCLTNLASSDALTNLSTDVRALYGIPGSDINYATSPVTSDFDPISGTTPIDNLSLIAGNVANYIDLTYDATTTDSSSAVQVTDPDGNTSSYLLQSVTADTSSKLGLSPGVYVFQKGNTSNFSIGQVKTTTAPKPIISPCNASKSDSDIKIGTSYLTMPAASCTSTHTNPALAWSIDRSSASVTNYKTVDYASSYTDGNAEMNSLAATTPTNYTSTLPTMAGVTLSVTLVDQNGNNPTLNNTSTACATPSPIYGCYYSITGKGIGCGAEPGAQDIYLSGIEYTPDTTQNIACGTGSTTVNPLKYVRGAKFACGVGGIDYGTVLTTYPGYKTSGLMCARTNQSASDLSKDISQRLDPPYTAPSIPSPISIPTSILPLLGGSTPATNQYLSDLNASTFINNSPGTLVNSLKLPGTVLGVTQCATTCGNNRKKVPIESGFCVDVPQPTCSSYSTSYTEAAENSDADYQQQSNDGFANWQIADNQVYGTLFAGTCIPGTRPNSDSQPIRFCTLDSTNNKGTISSVINPCVPVPRPPAWWPSVAKYVSAQDSQSQDTQITQAQWEQAWTDINYGFTNGTATGIVGTTPTSFPSSCLYNSAQPTNLNSNNQIPVISTPAGNQINAYLPNPYTNNCVIVPGLTVQTGNMRASKSTVEICHSDYAYYFKYNCSGNANQCSNNDNNNSGTCRSIFYYLESQSSCTPRGVTYSDGTGNTGSPLDVYWKQLEIDINNWPCCPGGTSPIYDRDGSGKTVCCAPNVSFTDQCYNQPTQNCSSQWINGFQPINNSCMKDGTCNPTTTKCSTPPPGWWPGGGFIITPTPPYTKEQWIAAWNSFAPANQNTMLSSTNNNWQFKTVIMDTEVQFTNKNGTITMTINGQVYYF